MTVRDLISDHIAVKLPLDRVTPACIVLYTVWTVYVHILSLTGSSFSTLLFLLPVVALAAAVSAFAWIQFDRRTSTPWLDRSYAHSIGVWSSRRWLFAGLAIIWVVIYAMTRNFTLFWWGSVVALTIACVTMFRRDAEHPPTAQLMSRRDALLLIGF